MQCTAARATPAWCLLSGGHPGLHRGTPHKGDEVYKPYATSATCESHNAPCGGPICAPAITPPWEGGLKMHCQGIFFHAGPIVTSVELREQWLQQSRMPEKACSRFHWLQDGCSMQDSTLLWQTLHWPNEPVYNWDWEGTEQRHNHGHSQKGNLGVRTPSKIFSRQYVSTA